MASNMKSCAEICSNCQKPFSSLATLNGGHSLVQGCTEEESDVVETTGISFCSYCIRGATLRGTPQPSTSAHLEQEETEIFCTYCLHAPIPAAKTCVQCEASLCDDHLRVHRKSTDHILIPPTSSIKNRKCLTHQKVMQYYCCEDTICVCVDCCQREHKGHLTETLNEAFVKEKRNLSLLLEQLTLTKEEIGKRGQSLQECWEREKEKVDGEIERVTALFTHIRRQLEDLERRLLAEISRHEEQIAQSVSDLIQQLEIQKEELTKKMCQLEELCETADPLTVLRDSKSQTKDVSEYIAHVKMARQSDENILPPIRESIHGLVSVTIHKSLTDIITQTTKLKGFFLEEVSDIKLDEKTSAWDLEISADQKTASWSSTKPLKPRMSMRKKNKKQIFECSQVLSTRNFSSGRYFWEVEIGEEGGVRLGVTYANVVKKGVKFHVGENEKSWCLRVWYKDYSAIYNRRVVLLNSKVECNKVGVFLDYRAGQLSFYELGSTIRHLHTFTTTFTEPLYAAFWVYHSWLKVIS